MSRDFRETLYIGFNRRVRMRDLGRDATLHRLRRLIDVKSSKLNTRRPHVRRPGFGEIPGSKLHLSVAEARSRNLVSIIIPADRRRVFLLSLARV